MAIVDTIESIKTNLANAYAVVAGKGATIPVNRNMENLPPTIASIPTGGGGASEYVRPSDWLPIPAMDGTKDEIYILNGVGVGCLNCIAFSIKGTGTVDWGDGVVETFDTTNIIELSHIYDMSLINKNTWSDYSKSFQVLIHISAERSMIKAFRTHADYPAPYAGNKFTLSSNDIYQISGDVQISETYFNRYAIFSNKLEIIDWKGELTGESTLIYGCNNLKYVPQLNISQYHGPGTSSAKLNECRAIEYLPDLDVESMSNFAYFFNSFYSLRKMPKLLNVGNITNMNSMFSKNYTLKEVYLFNTSSVTRMQNTFNDCYALLKLPKYNTRNVTDMTGMLSGCNALETIPQLDTRNVTNMTSMLYSCHALSKLPPINTSKVKTMTSTFNYCRSLKRIYEFDASQITSNIGLTDMTMLESLKIFNLNPSYTGAIVIGNLSNSICFKPQGLVDLFNSVAVNVNGYSRTIQLGTTLQGYLADVYVKDSGELYTAILATNDTEIDTNKTYYIYDERTGDFIETTPDFASDTIYYELKTATWNRYDICESTEAGAMLALDFARNVKGYTIT